MMSFTLLNDNMSVEWLDALNLLRLNEERLLNKSEH